MPSLRDGERHQYRSRSGRTYELYNQAGHVHSCTCPAWRNQGLAIEQRTCKHLREYLGSENEQRRINAAALRAAGVNPVGGSAMQYQPQTRVVLQTTGTASGPRTSITVRQTVQKGSPPVLPAVQAPNAWSRLMGSDPFGDDPPPPPVAVVRLLDLEDEATGERVTITETGTEFQVLLAETWDGVRDPTGYLMSEKLDGVRAYWDGRCFRSRLDNVFAVPQDFLDAFPKNVHLDGEFWMGRGRFQETSGYVRRKDMGDYWNTIHFRAFDVPSAVNDPFTKRYQMLQAIAGRYDAVELVEHQICRGIPHLRAYLAEIEAQGGEGVMLRQPGSLYERTRSQSLLKVKSFFDADATVVGHTAGRGKHRGKVGALQCRSIRFFNNRVSLEADVAFDVGTGLSDADRVNPPQVGERITFRFQGLTTKGVPRFPSYVGRRNYE